MQSCLALNVSSQEQDTLAKMALKSSLIPQRYSSGTNSCNVDSKFDIRPAGLGARDTLRLEAGFMLYGNDLDENITPLEVPLAWTVKFDKIQDFVGKNALRTNRLTRKLVGFEMLQRKRIARRGSEVFLAGSKIGFITSGGFSPTLNKSIGFCFVPSDVPFDQIVDLSITKGNEKERRDEKSQKDEEKEKENPVRWELTCTRQKLEIPGFTNEIKK